MGLLDVIALYPSIDQAESPKILATEIRNSKLKFENVDMYLMAVYLGTQMSRDQLKKEGL